MRTALMLVFIACVPTTSIVMRSTAGEIVRCDANAGDVITGGAYKALRSVEECAQDYERIGYRRSSNYINPSTTNLRPVVRRDGSAPPEPCSAADREEMAKAGVSVEAIASACAP